MLEELGSTGWTWTECSLLDASQGLKVYGIDPRETLCGDKKAGCSRHVHSVCGAGNDEGKKLKQGGERRKRRAIENGCEKEQVAGKGPEEPASDPEISE